jgi:hypothetical protein
MHTSVQWGQLLIMKMLIDEFDDDAEAMTTNGRTPLHVAAAFGQVRRTGSTAHAMRKLRFIQKSAATVMIIRNRCPEHLPLPQ